MRRHTPVIALLFGLAGALVAAPSAAVDPVNATLFGVAIDGYDPVAYFSESRPVEGSKQFTTDWMGARWRFANADNRERFLAEPERYAPQYGGYCAYAVSQGGTANIDPEAWAIVGDKLYLNLDPKIQERWQADRDRYIQLANENWPGLRSDS